MLTVNTDALAGDSIEMVSNEMCALATRIECAVRMQFNDVSILVYPNAEPTKVVEKFYGVCRSGAKHKLVVVRSQ